MRDENGRKMYEDDEQGVSRRVLNHDAPEQEFLWSGVLFIGLNNPYAAQALINMFDGAGRDWNKIIRQYPWQAPQHYKHDITAALARSAVDPTCLTDQTKVQINECFWGNDST